jgi:hypothetical protein
MSKRNERSSRLGPTPRDRRLLMLYGITEAEYDAIFRYQGGACAICCCPPVNVRLSLDHEHATGILRGLVCPRCNRGLAMFGDSPLNLRRASNYLTWHPARGALGGVVYGRPGRVKRKWRSKTEQRERTAFVVARVAEIWGIDPGKGEVAHE